MSKYLKYIYFFGGAFILTLGVACIITANIGTGSWDGVNVGIGKSLHIPFGTVAFSVGLIAAVVTAIIRKEKINILTLLTAFLLGYMTNFWLYIIGLFSYSNTIQTSLIFFLVGMIIQGIGSAFYLLPHFAPNAIDDAMMAVKEKYALSISVSKILFDGVGVIISFLVGGPIGFGTIIVTICMGPLIDFFYRILEKKQISVLK